MYQRSFAVVADEAYFHGLWALLNSIYAYHGLSLRVHVFLHGAGIPKLIAQLERHALRGAISVISTLDFESVPNGTWEAKQRVFAYLMGQVRCVCLLDADLVLLSNLDDVFEAAESGRIVSSKDGDDQTFGDDSAVYGRRVPGRTLPYFSSGFVGIDIVRHWDLCALWSFAASFSAYSRGGGHPLALPGWGDQGVLNGVAALLDKGDDLLAHERDVWCNPQGARGPRDYVRIIERRGLQLVVENLDVAKQQRLLHNTGPKWWTPEGMQHFAEWTDFLGCFRHFSQVPLSLASAQDCLEEVATAASSEQ